MGLQDERVLVEDDYTDYPDFVTLVEAHHGYPATSVQWQPATASKLMGSSGTELLATSGDALRVWEYSGDAPNGGQMSGYVNAKPSNGGHRLTLKSTLSGVSYALCLPYVSANEKTVESAATREHWCTNYKLLLERKSSLNDCDILNRHDLYRMEYRDRDSRNPTDCS